MKGSARGEERTEGRSHAQTIFSLLCSVVASSAPDVILLRFDAGDGKVHAHCPVSNGEVGPRDGIVCTAATSATFSVTVSLFIVPQAAAFDAVAGWLVEEEKSAEGSRWTWSSATSRRCKWPTPSMGEKDARGTAARRERMRCPQRLASRSWHEVDMNMSASTP